jgi:hypothetical protein
MHEKRVKELEDQVKLLKNRNEKLIFDNKTGANDIVKLMMEKMLLKLELSEEKEKASSVYLTSPNNNVRDYFVI